MFRTIPLIALALAVALSGCAGDASSSDGATSEPAATTPDTTAPDTTAPDTTTPDTTTPDTTTPDTTALQIAPAAVDVGLELDADEIAGLLWMREEEQLAHDVYAVLAEQWNLRIFENITSSEQTHIDLTIDLLDRYGLDDPAAGNEPGTFTDPTIQQLYDDLVARGLESEQDALLVGATIEELDIADLRVRSAATDEPAILDVYARLERGSRNHLRAFTGQLALIDVDYEATMLDDFDAIVTSPMERGRDDH